MYVINLSGQQDKHSWPTNGVFYNIPISDLQMSHLIRLDFNNVISVSLFSLTYNVYWCHFAVLFICHSLSLDQLVLLSASMFSIFLFSSINCTNTQFILLLQHCCVNVIQLKQYIRECTDYHVSDMIVHTVWLLCC